MIFVIHIFVIRVNARLNSICTLWTEFWGMLIEGSTDCFFILCNFIINALSVTYATFVFCPSYNRILRPAMFFGKSFYVGSIYCSGNFFSMSPHIIGCISMSYIASMVNGGWAFPHLFLIYLLKLSRWVKKPLVIHHSLLRY